MKNTIWVAMIAAAALLSACDKKDGGEGGDTSKAASGGDSTGVAECDAYFKKIKECKGMPAEAKKALDDAAKTMKDAIDKAPNAEAKKAYAQGCKTASDAITGCK